MLLSRSRPIPVEGVYYLYAAGFSLCFWLTATLNVLYMATEVGLSPFQMVVVGTVLEATVFLAEVPTGLVADLVSRRLSVLIGLALIGAGFLVQGIGSSFAAMLLAQLIWGIGYTFTSGADTAWLADEIGPDRLGPVLTAAQQLKLGATVVGIAGAGALGLIDIQLPLIASGAGFLLLAAVLAPLMRETGFVAVRSGGLRGDLAGMGRSLRAGLALARSRPVVRGLLIAGFLVGLASEAVDRLWTVRVVRDLDPPALGGQGPVALFTAISLVGTLIALAASLLVNRLARARMADEHPQRLVAGLLLVQAVAVAGIALLPSLGLVLGALWLRTAAAAVAAPVQSAWLNRSLDPATRATSLSINGQADAIGQVLGGPPLGAIGSRVGVPAALLGSALIMVPAAVVLARIPPPARSQPAP